jgi:hypothetical protein
MWEDGMGYRDDFYTPDNCVGYTGDLHNFPSVYFLTDKEYGHITTKHGYLQNVGRAEVKSNEGYTIGNETIAGERRLVERIDSHIIHQSRGVLTMLGQMSANDKAVMYQVIWQYPNEKLVTDFTTETRNQIHKTEDRHAALMREIRNKVPRDKSWWK